MRRLDPRPWNLLPSALLLAAACGPPGIPFEDTADDDIADDPDGPDADDGPDSSDDEPGECMSNLDCAPGYYCANETCKPEPYSDGYDGYDDDYSDWDGYDGYDDDYSDWDGYDGYDGYDDGPWYQCYSDEDCPPDYACVYNYCEPKPPPPIGEPVECEGPGIVEIPLPSLGTVLGLQFADVDGDDDDELVALRSDGIAVIQDDDAVVLTPWAVPPPVPLRQIGLLALDGDGAIDLVAFPDVVGPADVALGDGTGNFTSLGLMVNAPIVDGMVGFDGDLDGVDRLLGLRPDLERVAQFSNPTSLSGNHVLVGSPNASDLDLMQHLEPMLAPYVLIGHDCSATIHRGANLESIQILMDPRLGVGLCEWHAAAFIDGEADQSLLVFSQGGDAVLQRRATFSGEVFQLQVPIGPTSSAVANLDGTGDFVLLTDPGEGRMVWGWTDDDPGCIASLPFAGSLQFAVGDRDGDGVQDVATVDNSGVLRLWSVP